MNLDIYDLKARLGATIFNAALEMIDQRHWKTGSRRKKIARRGTREPRENFSRANKTGLQ